MPIDDKMLALVIAVTERMERFTPQDKFQFSHDLMTCPCFCARTMKDVLLPGMLADALKDKKMVIR